MMDWSEFVAAQGGVRAQLLFPGIWRLTEPALAQDCRSCFYLLDMPDALVLVDGGWGLVRGLHDLPGHTRGKPLVSIATHSHSDHIGALHLASVRYGHAAEAGIFADPDVYATQARPWIDDLVFAADGTIVDPATYRQAPCPLTQTVSDGDRLDFGAGPLHVLHTPGHSPGSICVLAERQGWLFCADTVHEGPIYDDIPGADVEALSLSHSRILDVDFRWALPGHGALLSDADVARRIARYRQDRIGSNRGGQG